jgi:hypothetical protein
MKNENSTLAVSELTNAEEHDLFHLFKTARSIKVTSEIPVKEELTALELSVYNILLHLTREFPFHQEEFTLEYLRNKLDSKYSYNELVDAFRNLDKKYYTECAFDDMGIAVWVKLL